MDTVTKRFIAGRGAIVALALAVLPGCAVTTGAGQSRLTLEDGFTARYTVCAGVQASRLRQRDEAGRECRRSEKVRVIL